jgi:hypothetical protein
LRIYDVSDLRNPRSKNICTGMASDIYFFTIYKHDTLFSYSFATSPSWAWSCLYYNHINNPTFINSISMSYLGRGPLAAVTGRYLEFQNDRLRMWKMPVTDRPADASVRVGLTGIGWEFAVTERYAFATEEGANLYIYDISNPTGISVIDTLPGMGTGYVSTYKNLLLRFNGASLSVFDISNINAIALAALYTGSVYECKTDSLTNYIYCLESNKKTVNILDLSKYVHQGTTISSNNPGLVALKANQPGISVSSTCGNVCIRYNTGTANKPAALCIYSLNGRMVHKTILSPSQTSSTFSLSRSLPCGVYLFRFSSGESVQTVKFIARND